MNHHCSTFQLSEARRQDRDGRVVGHPFHYVDPLLIMSCSDVKEDWKPQTFFICDHSQPTGFFQEPAAKGVSISKRAHAPMSRDMSRRILTWNTCKTLGFFIVGNKRCVTSGLQLVMGGLEVFTMQTRWYKTVLVHLTVDCISAARFSEKNKSKSKAPRIYLSRGVAPLSSVPRCFNELRHRFDCHWKGCKLWKANGSEEIFWGCCDVWCLVEVLHVLNFHQFNTRGHAVLAPGAVGRDWRWLSSVGGGELGSRANMDAVARHL